MRESSWARAARRLARNASARSSTSAIRRCSASGGRGIEVHECLAITCGLAYRDWLRIIAIVSR